MAHLRLKLGPGRRIVFGCVVLKHVLVPTRILAPSVSIERA